MNVLIAVLLITSFVGVLGYHTPNNTEHFRSESDILVRKARWLPLIYPRANPTRLQVSS